jgi:hypothetical protein
LGTLCTDQLLPFPTAAQAVLAEQETDLSQAVPATLGRGWIVLYIDETKSAYLSICTSSSGVCWVFPDPVPL